MKKLNKRLREVYDLIDKIKILLGIPNAEVRLREVQEQQFCERTNGVATAEVTYQDDYDTLWITIFPEFWEHSPASQRKIILHELCHTITHHLVRIARDLHAGKLVTPNEIEFANERTTSAIEHIVDGLLIGGFPNTKKAYVDFGK